MEKLDFFSRFFLSGAVIVLLFAGCGKQKDESGAELKSGKKIAQAESTELMAMADESIPLFEEEIEDFDDSINEFAVVENDEFSSFRDSIETESDSVKIADLSSDEDLFANDLDDVDWEDDELLALEEEVEEADNYKFKNVQFSLNKYGVTPNQENLLDENLKTARRAVEEGKSVTIIGHACQLGDGSFNMPLSENRAKTIKNVMIKRGINSDKIKVIGMGQERPLVWSNETDKEKLINDLAVNRRVEILIN